MKRSQVGIQFNWIFILIAGALILSFFFMIVNRQRGISEKKLANDLLADLDVIITGQAVSPGSSRTLDMAKLELDFTCDDYSITGVPRTTGNSIIFSPTKMKGETLLAWTLEWAMPYRAANFIYLTVPDIKYYVVDSAQNAGQDSFGIVSDFPKGVDIEAVSETPDKFEDFQRVRLVYFGEPLASELPLPSDALKDFNNGDVSVLYIGASDPEDFDGNAVMHFFKKKGDSIVEEGIFPAVGKETVYGAVFADNFELYFCNIEKAFKKLEVVTEVYRERVNYLLRGLPLGDPCSPYYTEEPLDGIAESINLKEGSLNQLDLFAYANQLENLNDRTIFASCPEIY